MSATTMTREQRLENGLRQALLIIEHAKPYVMQHACLTADDMRGLGGDTGDAYWIDVVERSEPVLKALLTT